MSVRAYVPTTLPLLAAVRDDGRFGPAPLAAHAVTPSLRACATEAGEALDDEDLEYAATLAAAVDSLRLLGDDDPQVRVVAAVDGVAVDPGDPEGQEPSAVLLHEVPLRRLAAVLVDTRDAARVVTAARTALAAGDEDDPAVERCLALELRWYAASELDIVLGG